MNKPKYDFPVLSVGDDTFCFNTPFARIFGSEYVRFRVSSKYLYIIPAVQGVGSYKLGSPGADRLHMYCRPRALTERRVIRPGRYRVCRAGSAFAVRRFEPMEETP